MNSMNKKHLVLLASAFVGLGMSMPSCPGQQAMQQQIDTLNANNTKLSQQVQALDAQVKTLNSDMSQVKQLLKPMSDAIQAQRTGMDQLDANIKEIQGKMAAMAAKPAPRAASKPAAKKHR
jgi:peptidoglycan hydrolase CwlO-like protein